jgi:predicted phosphate transport protein (TIGR00153 family)
MGFKEWIVPQDKVFFKLIQKQSDLVLAGAELFKDIVKDYSVQKLDKRFDDMRTLEHQSDEVVRIIVQKLHRSFITPIDHEDISRLCLTYDDVLDHINSVTNWIHLFELDKPDGAIEKFAGIIIAQIKEVDSALKKISKLKEKEIAQIFDRVHKLEEEADNLRNDSFVKLFRENDFRKVIIMKEIYEFLERITDLVDDVCLIVQDIVIKNA